MKISFLPVLLAAATGSAMAADDGLRGCRALGDATARLACYDALPLNSAAPAPVAAPVATAAPIAAAATAAPTAATFGLTPRRNEVDEVRSSIAGPFEGWGPGTRFTLANGQVWQVVDDSRGVYVLKDPQVTVRRAAMGTFMLEIEGARKAPRVRRIE